MNKYDKNKVEILLELKGRNGVAFVEYKIFASGKIKILKTENFYKKYGEKK